MNAAVFLLFIFFVSVSIHLLFTLFVFKVEPSEEIDLFDDKKQSPSLAILICAHNESENIQRHIPAICNQDYHNFDVFVVDHNSLDDTSQAVVLHQEKYENLHLVSCDQNNKDLPGKRAPLWEGLQRTDHDFVLLTDADCKPLTHQWAQAMVSRAMDTQADVVVGVSPYQRTKGLLNSFIQFETFHTAMSYIAALQQGWPFMAVGRNLLVKREVLFNSLKKSVVPDVKSGDDDLLIAHLSFTNRIEYYFDKKAHVESIPKMDYDDYLVQKARHVSTAAFYRGHHQFILFLFHMSLFLVYITGIPLLVTSCIKFVLPVLILRFLILRTIYKKRQAILQLPTSLLWLPIHELLFIIIPFLGHVVGVFHKKWN